MYPLTSSRWCPTPEQLMILEEMYRGGIRTPKSAQIQAITAHLSHYGKIEGKNVFYWFQNHKARERQKLRRKFMMSKQIHFQNQQQLQNPNQQIPQLFYYIPFEVHAQGGIVNASPQMMTRSGKGYPLTGDYQSHEMEKAITKTDGCDWVVMLDVRPKNKPLKTLELFPTRSSGYGLKNECTTSIQSISSSTSTN